MKQIVVLDVGGILATNLSPQLWLALGELSNTTSEQLYSSYKSEISRRLWSGEISELHFWQWLEQFHIKLSLPERSKLITDALQPMIALDNIKQWSQLAEIHIMSNHLQSWIQPILSPYQHYFKAIHVSDQYGLVKPNLEWFKLLDKQFEDADNIWFVDDSSHNIDAAKSIGWQTILGDEEQHWITILTEQLQSKDYSK